MSILTKMTGCALGAALSVAAGTAAAQEAAREVSISLASTSFATAAPRIADELGLFEKHGLDPNFIVMDSANVAATAMISGSVEAAVAGPGEVFAAQTRGQKAVAIASAYRGFSGTLILDAAVAEGLGVAADAPPMERLAALDGLTLATPSPTAAYTAAVKSAAESAGANVTFAYMGQPAMLAALESGAVQGFVGGAPLWAAAVTKGSGTLWISGPKGELPAESTSAIIGTLQMMQDVADANPDLVDGMRAVLDDLGQAIEERPDEVRAAVGRLYPDIDPETLDVLFEAESAAWRDPALMPVDMERDIAFIKVSGAAIEGLDQLDPAAMIYSRTQ